jgi:hypothetical protein
MNLRPYAFGLKLPGMGGDQLLQEEKPAENAVSVQPSLPESVARLYEYFKKYPVSAKCTARETRIIKPESWRNDAVETEISNLIFRDMDCFEYLHDHPVDVITRSNFLKGVK